MVRIVKILLLSTALVSTAGFATWQGARVSAALTEETETAPRRGGGSGGRPGHGARGAAAQGEVVDIATAQATTMQPVSIAYGRITAPRSAQVAAAVSGEVAFVKEGLRDGALVQAGDVLFKIDDAEAASTLREAEIARRAAEAALENDRRRVSELSEELVLLEEQLEIAQAELERTRPLVDRGLSGVAALDAARSSELSARQGLVAQKASISTAENEVAQGEIAVEQAVLAVERAERALADHEVVAPIDGEFSGSAPLAGQSVTTAAIGEIVDLSQLEARLELSQAALSRITGADGRAIPLEVELRRPSGDVRALARIDRLALDTSTDDSESSVAIATLLAEPGARLRPGDFVEARILEETLDGVVALPVSAVSPEGRVAFVEAGQAVFETVEVIRASGNEVFVEGGIAGRSYVVTPGAELTDGQAVMAQTEGAAEGEDGPAAQNGERPRAVRDGARGGGAGGRPETRPADAPAADRGEG